MSVQVQVEVAQSAEVAVLQSPETGVVRSARPRRTPAMALRRAWEWLTQDTVDGRSRAEREFLARAMLLAPQHRH